MYFPLTVDEAMLIEPTETESVETLDAFADTLIAIAHEAETDPEVVKTAPHTAPVRRLDEVGAARNPNLRWRPGRQRLDALPGLDSPGFDTSRRHTDHPASVAWPPRPARGRSPARAIELSRNSESKQRRLAIDVVTV